MCFSLILGVHKLFGHHVRLQIFIYTCKVANKWPNSKLAHPGGKRKVVSNIRMPRIFTCMELPKGQIDVIFLDVDGVLNFGTHW